MYIVHAPAGGGRGATPHIPTPMFQFVAISHNVHSLSRGADPDCPIVVFD